MDFFLRKTHISKKHILKSAEPKKDLKIARISLRKRHYAFILSEALGLLFVMLFIQHRNLQV